MSLLVLVINDEPLSSPGTKYRSSHPLNNFFMFARLLSSKNNGCQPGIGSYLGNLGSDLSATSTVSAATAQHDA